MLACFQYFDITNYYATLGELDNTTVYCTDLAHIITSNYLTSSLVNKLRQKTDTNDLPKVTENRFSFSLKC